MLSNKHFLLAMLASLILVSLIIFYPYEDGYFSSSSTEIVFTGFRVNLQDTPSVEKRCAQIYENYIDEGQAQANGFTQCKLRDSKSSSEESAHFCTGSPSGKDCFVCILECE